MQERVEVAGGEGVRFAVEDAVREADVLIDIVGDLDGHCLCCGAAAALRGRMAATTD
ncbi:hypothetical protein [Streptomyces sp. Ncost-T10-10d]|uniref:hypothetical protein n=1 Tax=Streptomyces sp. Ncost-T10-10d TaxID=1839774 RepID=UPI00159F17DA|nr:hypothetical protein [Streptomyces sp. Ncost-T10-10d]